MIIYKATNLVNNKVYIGQTIHSLTHRRKQHERSWSYGRDYLFPRAINKYGTNNFEWEVLYTTNDLKDLNEKECYYINLYDSTNPNKGYNIKAGGNNSSLPDSVKEKISNAQKGELNHMYGKTGELNHSSKKVKNVTTGEIFGSAMECANKLQINHSHVSAVCRGDRGSTNNMIFRYIDDSGNIIEPNKETQVKAKRVQNIDTGEIFESASDAEKHCSGKKNGNISKVCKGTRKLFAGYRWGYID